MTADKKNMDAESYRSFVAQHEGLMRRIAEIVKHSLEGKVAHHMLDEVTFTADEVKISYTVHRSGDSDLEFLSFPASFLYIDNWREEFGELKAAEQKKAKEAAAKREQERKERERQAKYERYLQLKKEFEGQTP